MGRLNNLSAALLIFLFITGLKLNAQSDYEKMQNFKNEASAITDAIKNAKNLYECQRIADRIEIFEAEFMGDKSLLDKTLYPDNFDHVIENLTNALTIRKGDFTQISELKTEVGTLKDQISDLNKKNDDLISQILVLKKSQKQDAETIASLRSLVSELKYNIQERDNLVRGIVDNLLAQFVKHPFSLNDAEKKAVFDKVESENLFFNVERAINDNIKFMKVTLLNKDDLSEMKTQYLDFSKVWGQIGPKLADVYIDKEDRSIEIENIDDLFNKWNELIDKEIWTLINKSFKKRNINLLTYRSGDEFTLNISSFIDSEIKSIGIKSSGDLVDTYSAFADSTWFNEIKPEWIPILIDTKLMTVTQVDTIETKISEWKTKVAPASTYPWLYILLAAIIVILAAVLFIRWKRAD